MKLLERFYNLKELSLHGNHLKMLPSLSQLHIVSLDITHNPLRIDNYLLDSLFSLRTLEHLEIDGNEDELERVVQNLPELKSLNGKKIVREKKVDKKNDIGLKYKNALIKQRQKIQKFAKVTLDKFDYEDKKSIMGTLETNFKDILKEYEHFSQNVSIDTAKQGVYLFSKNKIIDWFQDKLIIMLSQLGMENIADAFEDIGAYRKEYFDSMLKIVLQVGYNQVCLEQDLGQQINPEMKTIKLRKQKLYLKQIMRLKKKLNDYESERSKIEQENMRYIGLLYSLTKVDYQTYQKIDLKPNIIKPLDLIPDYLAQNGDRTPRVIDNRSLTPSKMNQNRPNLNILINKPVLTPSHSKSNLSVSKNNLSPSQSKPTLTPSQSKPILTPSQSKKNLTPSKSTHKLKNQIHTPKKNEKQKQNKVPKTLLTYDQTITLIWEFMTAKKEHNQRCYRKRGNFDTAEEFLSDFFTSKYGVKSIALGSTLNFIRSLELYSRQNTLCEVFLKILKHTIEESFFQQHSEFMGMLEQKLVDFNKRESLSANQAQKIFYRVFPGENSIAIKGISSSYDVNLDYLVEEMCKLHIKLHERTIADFNRVYREIDSDGDGIVNFQQAKDFVTAYFGQKIEKKSVTSNILERVVRKLQNGKKNKIVYSQLIDMVYRID